MLDTSVSPVGIEGVAITEWFDCTLYFRKASLFDSVTDDGRKVAEAFDKNDCRFECTMKTRYLGCQRVSLDISTRVKGFQGPSEDFVGTTDDEFEMIDGPIIRIGEITPDTVTILLKPSSHQ